MLQSPKFPFFFKSDERRNRVRLAWGLVMVHGPSSSSVLAAMLYWTLFPLFSYQCWPSPFDFYTSSHSCSHFFLEMNKVSPAQLCGLGGSPSL